MKSEEQIKHMVDRFLGWKLPENFNPDAGINFKATFNEHTAHPMKHKPSGTNLFDATQADAMVRYMVAGMTDDPRGGDCPVAPTHRHKKRGTEYLLIGTGKMQAGGWSDAGAIAAALLGEAPLATSVDMREVAIYRAVDDGSLWVRPREEFEDGRFDVLPVAATVPVGNGGVVDELKGWTKFHGTAAESALDGLATRALALIAADKAEIARLQSILDHIKANARWWPYPGENSHELFDVLVVGQVERFAGGKPAYGNALGLRTGAIDDTDHVRAAVISEVTDGAITRRNAALVKAIADRESKAATFEPPIFDCEAPRTAVRGASQWLSRWKSPQS